MNFSLLPNPEIIQIPEKLKNALNKLKKSLEKDVKMRASTTFSDLSIARKSSEYKGFTGSLNSLEADLDYCEDVAFEKCISPINEPQKLEKTFKELLFEIIDSKGLNDSDVYNKALLDRRLFSKIRTNDSYHPSKGTILQLSLALELSIKETLALLKSADYYLTKNSEENVIMYYVIENKIFNVVEANNILYSACGRTIDQL